MPPENSLPPVRRTFWFALILSLCWSPERSLAIAVVPMPSPLTAKEVATIMSKAASGDAPSQALLGDWHCTGSYGMRKNSKEAAAWYRRAARQNSASAQVALGVMYELGQGIPRDHNNALDLIRKGAAHYSDAHLQQYGVSREDAVRWEAQQNRYRLALIALSLGMSYANGSAPQDGCNGKAPRDIGWAIEWFRISDQAGHVLAAWHLGALYESESQVRDFAEAMKWYLKAADQRWAEAMVALGRMYAIPEGVPQDYGQAAAWYRRASAEDGFSGKYELALLYEQGLGVPVNLKAALELYHQVPGANNAQQRMFSILEKKLGAPQDEHQAIDWYRDGAMKGNAWAQVGLGLHYESGKGVPMNLDAALALYNSAVMTASSAGNDVPDLRHTIGLDRFRSGNVKDYVQDLTRKMAAPGNLLPALDEYVAHPKRPVGDYISE
jgi:TPR repeat protein